MRQFHYGFDLNENEKIVHKALANMHDNDLIVNGALYLTNERLYFVGYLPNTGTRMFCEVSLYHVKEVRPEKTFRIFNNILRIIGIGEEQYKFIVDDQKIWLKEIDKQLNLLE